MKKIKAEIKLYSYEELNEDSKNKAFEKHKDFLDSLEEEYENEKGEMIKEYIDHDKETVEDSININGYLFFSSGDIADCVTYTGKHKKAGTTEFKFMDVVYLLD
ncbi:hypothetical protein BMS3Abin17_00062 [archaeon BMS3Abin17]|nr:hypothetical protein BMS3Abin17_00062 [archaeon BMS3Abin17]